MVVILFVKGYYYLYGFKNIYRGALLLYGWIIIVWVGVFLLYGWGLLVYHCSAKSVVAAHPIIAVMRPLIS